MDLLRLSITKWNDFNYREDRKNYSWFKFSNDYFTDDKTLGWSLYARIVFIYLLCVRSKSDSDVFLVNVSKISFCFQITPEESLKYIEELETHAVLRRHHAGMKPASRHVEKRRKEKKREDAAGFPFDEIFREYPKRKGDHGKKRAFERLKKTITSEADFERVKRAAKNYRGYCVAEKIEGTAFVKQFATWVGVWEEWENQLGFGMKTPKTYTADDLKAINEGLVP